MRRGLQIRRTGSNPQDRVKAGAHRISRSQDQGRFHRFKPRKKNQRHVSYSGESETDKVQVTGLGLEMSSLIYRSTMNEAFGKCESGSHWSAADEAGSKRPCSSRSCPTVMHWESSLVQGPVCPVIYRSFRLTFASPSSALLLSDIVFLGIVDRTISRM